MGQGAIYASIKQALNVSCFVRYCFYSKSFYNRRIIFIYNSVYYLHCLLSMLYLQFPIPDTTFPQKNVISRAQ